MSTTWFAIPGDLDAPTGGYRYDRAVLRTAANLGEPLQHLQLPDGFPFPSDADLTQTRARLAALPKGATVMIDGLALGAMPADMIDDHGLDLIALVHHPLALETGLTEDQASILRRSELSVLTRARHVIVTSPITRDTLIAQYNVPATIITVALPGLEHPADVPDRAQRTNGPVELLSVGSLIPRKGYDWLIDALAPLRDLNWTARIAGVAPGGSDLQLELMRQVEASGLADRVTFLGALEPHELQSQYRSADLFVLLTRYEGYGMVFAEAMSWGLPVIAGAGGAVPDTVPPDAGVLVPVNDVAAATGALRRLILDRNVRLVAGSTAYAHSSTLPTWQDTTQLILTTLAGVNHE